MQDAQAPLLRQARQRKDRPPVDREREIRERRAGTTGTAMQSRSAARAPPRLGALLPDKCLHSPPVCLSLGLLFSWLAFPFMFVQQSLLGGTSVFHVPCGSVYRGY